MHSRCVSKSKQALFCLALAILSPRTWADAGDLDDPPGASPMPAVTIYMDFQLAPSVAVVEAIHAEVASLLAPAEFRLEWRPLADFRTESVSAAVVVAHFEDRCDASDLVMRQNQRGSLGWTEMSDSRVLPYIHVDCTQVRTYLQTALLGYRARDREGLYARALGRVLAHELYHTLTRSPQHGAHGVSGRNFSVQDLLGANFQFSRNEIEALRVGSVIAGLRAARKSF